MEDKRYVTACRNHLTRSEWWPVSMQCTMLKVILENNLSAVGDKGITHKRSQTFSTAFGTFDLYIGSKEGKQWIV